MTLETMTLETILYIHDAEPAVYPLPDAGVVGLKCRIQPTEITLFLAPATARRVATDLMAAAVALVAPEPPDAATREAEGRAG